MNAVIGRAGHETQPVGHRIEIDHDRRIIDWKRSVHLGNVRCRTGLKIDGDDPAVRRYADYGLVGGAEINADEAIDAGNVHGLGDRGTGGVEQDESLVSSQAKNRRGKDGATVGKQNRGGDQCDLHGLHLKSPCWLKSSQEALHL
jgi:hypothetical protein